MKENVRDQLQMHLRRAAVAVLAIGAVAAGTAHADPSDFRQGKEYAVLDHSVFAVAGQTVDAPPVQDFGPIDTVLSYELAFELDRLFDVKQVRAQMTRTDTGTTFMLTDDGSYLIRHPTVEWIHQLMETPPN
jgi:hypothetical protein